MTPATIGKFVEQVGVPAAMAAGAGFLAWYLLKWMTGNLGKQMSEIKQEIKDETDEVQNEVRLLHNITIKLVDRIRVMERNQMAAHTEMLTKLNCKIPLWDTTRSEQHAEKEEELKDIGVRNGEMGVTVYKHFKLVPARKWRWPSFSPAEVGCRHCGWIRINPDFLDTLQSLRDQRGPTTVSNVCRCAVHNARVGGAPGSMHLMGMAADVALLGAARKGLQQAAIAVGFQGFGYYQTFLHVDLGRSRFWGKKELWNA